MGSEMDPLNSPDIISYRLPNPYSNYRSSFAVLAVLRMFQTDGQTNRQTDRRNWSSDRRHYALKCIGRQKLVDIYPKLSHTKIKVTLFTAHSVHTLSTDSRRVCDAAGLTVQILYRQNRSIDVIYLCYLRQVVL